MRLCENVSFSYPGAGEVLRSLNLSVEPGGRMVLTGPSGCGKTTLLYLLAGLLTPTAGCVEALPVSMVFQEDRLPPRLTAVEQLRLVAPGKGKDELKGLLAELGLAGWEDAPPEKMSGGMRRRVALARAVAFGAPLWLLDEPFTGLDTTAAKQAAAFMLRHMPQNGFLIAALHKPEEAVWLETQMTFLGDLQG